MKKKIPYGISDFKKLIEQNYQFIDKTKYLETIENLNEPYLIFLRPRRFGKSLFLSLLDYYYDINSKDDFDSLFKGLYIHKNPTPMKNSYYILRFNFSGINTENYKSVLEGFNIKIIEGFTNFENKYDLKIEYNKTGYPSEIFTTFLTGVRNKLKNDNKIYCLIDEYDHFANELLGFKVDAFKDSVSQTGFVRKWYEVLKIGTETGLIDRIFITGVSPITLDSMTSGFNIASNETRTSIFNEMQGFVKEEVKTLIKTYISSDKKIIDEVMSILIKYYNGYLFSENAKERVFNSDMVLYYISRYNIDNRPPRELVDSNIASDYAKMRNLFTLANKDRNFKILDSIMKGEEQNVSITKQFSLEKEFTSDDFKSLLFYMGFLTIDRVDEYNDAFLKVPNYVIKELYFDFFYKIINDDIKYDLDISNLKKSIKQFALNGDIRPFMDIVQAVLKRLSNRDYIKFDEKYVKVIMLTYLIQSKLYYVKSEYEVDGGYIDITLLKNPNINPKYQAIFEVKYIKKGDYTEELYNKKIKEAKEQLARYKSSAELMNIENLVKYIVIIVGSEVKLVEAITDYKL